MARGADGGGTLLKMCHAGIYRVAAFPLARSGNGDRVAVKTLVCVLSQPRHMARRGSRGRPAGEFQIGPRHHRGRKCTDEGIARAVRTYGLHRFRRKDQQLAPLVKCRQPQGPVSYTHLTLPTSDLV